MRSNLTLVAAGVMLGLSSLPASAETTQTAPKLVPAHATKARGRHVIRRHRWVKRHAGTKIMALMHFPIDNGIVYGSEALPPSETQTPVTTSAVTSSAVATTAPAPVLSLTPAKPTPDPVKVAKKAQAPATPHVGITSISRLVSVSSVASSPTRQTPQRVTIPATDAAPKVMVGSRVAKVSLEFVNADVVQILRALALQTNVNIVATPEVKGNLTVSLNDVPVEDALKMVTGMSGLAYAMVGSTVLVAPRDKIDTIRRAVTGEPTAQPEESVSDAYIVHGGKASELVDAICGKGSTSVGQVSLVATPQDSFSRQAIVLHGPQTQVVSLKKTLEQLDVPAQSVVEGYEIYEVKHLDPRALREDLIVAFPGLRASVLPSQVSSPGVFKPAELQKNGETSVSDSQKSGGQGGQGGQSGQGGQAGGSSSAGGTADVKSADDTNSSRESMGVTQPFQAFEKISVPMTLVLRGPRSLIDQALTYLGKIDLPPRQVAIELRVMELTKNDALNIGLDWSLLNGNGTVQAVQSNEGLGGTSASPGVFSAILTGQQSIVATLDKSATKNNLIARPNLLAVDGREAEVFVGDVIRYIQTIESSQNGTTVQTGEEHVGVRLAIFPRIGADGTIVMELRPIVTYLTGFTPVPGGGELPQTSERVEQTTAVMHDGDTIALGGLIQDQDEKTIAGIPFLKDLPIIGELFRRTTKDRSRTEIVFFLTAKIVNPQNKATAADPRIDKPVPLAPDEMKHGKGPRG